MPAHFITHNGRSRVERKKLLHEICNSGNFSVLIDHRNNNCTFTWYHSILRTVRSYFEVLPIINCLHGTKKGTYLWKKCVGFLNCLHVFFYFNNILSEQRISHLSFLLFFIASCCSVALFRLLHLLEFPVNETCSSLYFVSLVTFLAVSIKKLWFPWKFQQIRS